MDAKRLLGQGKRLTQKLSGHDHTDDAGRSGVSALAAARGWEWRGDLAHHAMAELGLDLAFGADDVALADGPVRVLCGNNGTTLYDDGARRPKAANFIAVRHGLDLPHLKAFTQVRPPFPDSKLAKAGIVVGSVAVVAAGGLDGGGGGEGPSSKFRLFKDVKVPRKSNIRVLCETDRVAEGQAMMTGQALEILRWLALGFDVESREGWLIGWANLYDLVGDDPLMWDWLEAGCSGLFDLAAVWGAQPGFGRSWSQYTSARGTLPTRAVPTSRFKPAKRSRL